MPLVLRNPAFRRVWLAYLFSLAGSQVSRIGLILLVVQLTDSVPTLAALVALETLPGALAAPLAGVVVDRSNKRVVMIAADLVRFGSLVAILVRPSVPMICAMAAVQSVATSFFHPARAAAVPLIVREHDLVSANSWDQGAANVMFIAGPIIGTELMLSSGVRWTLVIDAATFLLSAVLLRRLLAGAPTTPPPGRLFRVAVTDIQSGWRYLKDHELALHLCAVFFVSLLCAGLWMPLAPFFIRDHLGGAPRLLGWQFAAFGAGAVVGSAVVPLAVARWGRGAVLFGGLLGEGLCQAAYAAVPLALVSTMLIFSWGIVVSVIVVPFYSLIQTLVDERFRGRVFATIRQSESVAMALAMGAAALLQDHMNSQSILLVGGLAYCAVAIASCATPGGRRLLVTR